MDSTYSIVLSYFHKAPKHFTVASPSATHTPAAMQANAKANGEHFRDLAQGPGTGIPTYDPSVNGQAARTDFSCPGS